MGGTDYETEHIKLVGSSNDVIKELQGLEKQSSIYRYQGDFIQEQIDGIQTMKVKSQRQHSLDNGKNNNYGISTSYDLSSDPIDIDNSTSYSNATINAKSLFLRPRRAPPPVPIDEQR